MTRYVRPIAASLMLLLGALPGASLACEWVCAQPPAAASAHHHAAGHAHHEGATVQAAQWSAFTLRATVARCAHVGPAIRTQVRSGNPGLSAPAAVTLTAIEQRHDSVDTLRAAAAHVAHGPPGARAAALPLRI